MKAPKIKEKEGQGFDLLKPGCGWILSSGIAGPNRVHIRSRLGLEESVKRASGRGEVLSPMARDGGAKELSAGKGTDNSSFCGARLCVPPPPVPENTILRVRGVPCRWKLLPELCLGMLYAKKYA